jgi:hypothetical protein
MIPGWFLREVGRADTIVQSTGLRSPAVMGSQGPVNQGHSVRSRHAEESCHAHA